MSEGTIMRNLLKFIWRKRMGIEPTLDARRTEHRI